MVAGPRGGPGRRHRRPHRRLPPGRRRARPHPAVRGHARARSGVITSAAPALPPRAPGRAAGRLRLRLLRRRATTPAAASCAGAPPRPCSASTTPPRPTAPTAPATGPCCWSSTRATPALVDAVLAVVTEECAGAEVLDVEPGRALDGAPQRRAAPSRRLTRKGFVVDTMEVSGPWSALPRIYEDGVAAAARRRGDAGRLGPPVAQLPRRRLPLLHLRRPAAPRTSGSASTSPPGTPPPGRCWPPAAA